ncbi:c-type cytochrome [Acidicapsa ligni]|uniref:c-type cytochrome n=1 Tax=Acidicapsa ligni TaxID=542300 RepID=UPI0021DFD910|nr:c-type cytochrome [Acidicapsa ligni]
MNRYRVAAVLALIASGFMIYQGTERPVHAAAHGSSSGSMASASQAMQQPPAGPVDAGAISYAKHCAICHGDQREGILPAFPPLLGIQRQLTDEKLTAFIYTGKGRMPGFPKISKDEMTALLHYLTTTDQPAPETTSAVGASGSNAALHSSRLSAAGSSLFQQNCAFCHGRDAMGGETGPDLTQSKLVQGDKNGDAISGVVREGRPEKKMPAFNFSSQELLSLVAFIRERETAAASMKGNRRGVAVADLQTGNAQAGKTYFNGAGGCSKCHSPSGDLAGIANRFEGLRLEERMLYPSGAKSKLTVTIAPGKTISGTLAYRDEFTVGMRDADGTYRSWATNRVKYTVDSPVQAHVEQFPKYTDDDIHNLMAYLQTLR